MIDTLKAHKLDKKNKRDMMKAGANHFYDIGDLTSLYSDDREKYGAFLPESGWKRCPKPWSNYFVSTDGQVMGQMGEVVKTSINNGGYEIVVGVNDTGKHTTTTVHRLLALAWLPNPEGLSDVDHLNSDRLDNNLSNLRFLSHAENLRGREKTFQGRPVTCHEVKTGKLMGQYKSMIEAQRETGVSAQTIAGICNKKYKSGQAKGYTFAYLDVSEHLHTQK